MTADIKNNVVSLLRRARDRVPDRAALITGKGKDDEIRISFAELWDRVDRVSVGLRRHGFRPGERAVLMIPMSVDLYAVLLGVLKTGGAAVFVDPWIGMRRIAAFSAFAEPAAFIGLPRSHLLRQGHRVLRRIPLMVTTSARWWRFPAPLTLRELEETPGDAAIHPVVPGDPGLITFTTGSSGIPKGANRTHGFLAAQHRALETEFPSKDEDVDLSVFPVFALHNIAGGITTVIPSMDFRRTDRADPGTILSQMRHHRVTTCTCSPSLLDLLTDVSGKGKKELPLLRRVITGGAPVSRRQLVSWNRSMPGVDIRVAYGSTEAEPVSHLSAEERLSLTSDLRPQTPGFCTGKPSPLVRVRVVRIHKGEIRLEKGSWKKWELPRGEIGELVVSGEHVCRDYYRNPEAVAANKIPDPDGTVWHRMGDTGYLDREGRFWLVGRVHSTIRRNGIFVHPQLLEEAARGEDNRIGHIAAVGLADEEKGEKVMVVVETRDEGVLPEVRRRLEEKGLPVDDLLQWKGSLPLDPRHRSKVDYARLREMLA